MNVDDAIGLLSAAPQGTGIFCDFDGTLSPIVDRPEDARPVTGALAALEGLARAFAVVGVISGRSLDDLVSRFAPKGVLLAGSYGRERSDVAAPPAPRDWAPVAAAAAGALGAGDRVVVERKGTGVALHYRLAPERVADVERVAADLAREFSLEVRRGRMVAEVVEPGPGKAEALAGLVEQQGLDQFLFAGDDVADGEAFAWARASRRTCVLVGVRSAESPDVIEREADVVVEEPEEFVALLEGVLSRVLRRPG